MVSHFNPGEEISWAGFIEEQDKDRVLLLYSSTDCRALKRTWISLMDFVTPDGIVCTFTIEAPGARRELIHSKAFMMIYSQLLAG
jgi:hypothetical protein